MSRSIWGGCVILVMAALMAGCGSKPEDNLVKEKITLTDQMSEAFEKVTDKKSFNDAQTEVKSLAGKIAEVDQKLKDLGDQRKEAAFKTYATQYDQAMDRLKTAKEKAAKAASKT